MSFTVIFNNDFKLWGDFIMQGVICWEGENEVFLSSLSFLEKEKKKWGVSGVKLRKKRNLFVFSIFSSK